MNFDDQYMFNLSLKISDYENANKLYKKIYRKINQETYDNLSKYCTDLKIYNLFEKNNKNINNLNFLLNLMTNPYNNIQIIKQHLENIKTNYKIDEFVDNDNSVLLNLLKNSNNFKKLTISEFLLDKNSISFFDFNKKNNIGQKNSQI